MASVKTGYSRHAMIRALIVKKYRSAKIQFPGSSKYLKRQIPSSATYAASITTAYRMKTQILPVHTPFKYFQVP